MDSDTSHDPFAPDAGVDIDALSQVRARLERTGAGRKAIEARLSQVPDAAAEARRLAGMGDAEIRAELKAAKAAQGLPETPEPAVEAEDSNSNDPQAPVSGATEPPPPE